jgi:hypothetical protein
MTNIAVTNEPELDSVTVNIGKWVVTVTRDVTEGGRVLVDVLNEKKGEHLTYVLGEKDPEVDDLADGEVI